LARRRRPFPATTSAAGPPDAHGARRGRAGPPRGAHLDRPVVLTAVTALLSNLVSNVPAVLLLKSLVPKLADPQRAWLILAMASTLAGNLTLVGSVANLIVVESARGQGVRIGMFEYCRVGVPVTLLTLLAGWLILAFSPL
jgi:Na+/H+ antiporter NhaD/arsenite permease-like protein